MKITVPYNVVRGDSLFAIARRFNMTVNELKSLNKLTSNTIFVGQTLNVLIDQPAPPPKPTPSPNPPSPTPPTIPVQEAQSDVFTARRQVRMEVRPENGFNRYILTLPLLDGRTIQASLRDNVTMSRFMIYPHGLLYPGQSLVELDLATVQSVGLTRAQAGALQYTSTHEGKFDAINSYDKGIFSYGFIQFVAARASGGSLNRLLDSMKRNAPGPFQRLFQRVGINSEGGSTTVLNDTGGKLWGDDAWLYIQRLPALCAPFIQAGFEPALIREQLRMANELYIQPSLKFSLYLYLRPATLQVPQLEMLLRSEAMLTAVFALAVSRGIRGMSDIVSAAITTVANDRQAFDLASIQRIDERLFAQQISLTATDERIRNRINGVLASGLSFNKNTIA